MIGLPEGHCEFCGLKHPATDMRCPSLPTLGENLIVEYRRAKRRVLDTGAPPDFTARELAGLCLTIGGERGARGVVEMHISIGRGRRGTTGDSDERAHEARRLVDEALAEKGLRQNGPRSAGCLDCGALTDDERAAPLEHAVDCPSGAQHGTVH